MVINILWTFVGVSAVAGIFFLLYGLLHFGLCLRKGRGDIDQSNVWNRLMGVTYTAMHPEVFGGIEFWKNDLCENIKLVKKAIEDIESCGSQQVDEDGKLSEADLAQIDQIVEGNQLNKWMVQFGGTDESGLLDLIKEEGTGGFPIQIDESLDEGEMVFVTKGGPNIKVDIGSQTHRPFMPSGSANLSDEQIFHNANPPSNNDMMVVGRLLWDKYSGSHDGLDKWWDWLDKSDSHIEYEDVMDLWELMGLKFND